MLAVSGSLAERVYAVCESLKINHFPAIYLFILFCFFSLFQHIIAVYRHFYSCHVTIFLIVNCKIYARYLCRPQRQQKTEKNLSLNDIYVHHIFIFAWCDRNRYPIRVVLYSKIYLLNSMLAMKFMR